jgi:hypothetical protein
MLNEGDGSDLLVWNPFSLQQLLQYVKCLRELWDTTSRYHQPSCESLKPSHPRLQ